MSSILTSKFTDAFTGPIIWMHEDALTYHHPVFQAAGEAGRNLRAVFVWDSAYFQLQGYSLKRLTFIYECLIDLQRQNSDAGNGINLDVFSGDMQSVLAKLMRVNDRSEAAKLYLAGTPNPIFLDIANSLAQKYPVKIIPNRPFIDAPDDVDMTRFFRFWNRSRRSALGL